jgi:hypothetical protein
MINDQGQSLNNIMRLLYCRAENNCLTNIITAHIMPTSISLVPHSVASQPPQSPSSNRLFRLILLPTRHQTQENPPSHSNNTAKHHAPLNRHQRQANKTNQRPQLLASKHQRPEPRLHLLPAGLPTLSAKHRDPHEERDSIEDRAEGLVEEELDGRVADAELFLVAGG